jgi:hypothetical protein
MQQTLQLNIIPFNHSFTSASFAFYNKPELAKQEGYYPIFKNDLGELLNDLFSEDELSNLEKLYTDFQEPKEDAIIIEINLAETPRFANHYYRYLVRHYFTGKVDIIHQNFTSETEVWLHNKKGSTPEYNLYNQFTIKVQNARLTELPELVISYDGTTKVLTKSVLDITDLDTNLYNWIVCEGVLYKFRHRNPAIQAKANVSYPVLSNTLKPHLGIAHDSTNPFRNRYTEYKPILDEFYKKLINTESFKKLFPIASDGFLKITADQFSVLSKTSKELVFGGTAPNNIGTEPKADFKYKGPYRSIPSNNNIRFFFIYHKPEKETAMQAIYTYFKDGFNGQWKFPSMQQYIKHPFSILQNESFAFNEIDTAPQEVKQFIRNKERLPNTTYFAIYVNPVPKDEPNQDRVNIYYKIKELLLIEGISSQVIKSPNLYNAVEAEKQLEIWRANNPQNLTEAQLKLGLFKTDGVRQKIFNQDFNTFLPHIQIAILAKLGGIPWRLNRINNKELIVGVGAFYSKKIGKRFVGSAFCFDNEGVFKGFDCFNSDDTLSLAGSIREAVLKFIIANESASRLVIHFYKDIGEKELKPIKSILYKLGLNIPIVVVTINKTESKDLIAFDTSYSNLMPFSGTFIKVGYSEYLLFNNTRYDATSTPKKKEFHFPIKLSITSTDKEEINSIEKVELFIDQVYQFSRMYWKSNDQQSLPVTIKYPEMVAKIWPNFDMERPNDFARENLWFL